MKAGDVIVIIGRQGSGKTPIAKERMNKSGYKNKVVFDYRNEYGDDVTTFKTFAGIKKALPKLQGSFIIVEEATAFISSFKSFEIADLLMGIQHNRNICCFLFHSLLDTPPYILRMSRYIILLPTNDDATKVKAARAALYPYFMNPKKPIVIDNYK